MNTVLAILFLSCGLSFGYVITTMASSKKAECSQASIDSKSQINNYIDTRLDERFKLDDAAIMNVYKLRLLLKHAEDLHIETSGMENVLKAIRYEFEYNREKIFTEISNQSIDELNKKES